MNRGFGVWVSNFIIVCYGYVARKAFVCLRASNTDNPAASTAFVTNSGFIPASLSVGHQN